MMNSQPYITAFEPGLEGAVTIVTMYSRMLPRSLPLLFDSTKNKNKNVFFFLRKSIEAQCTRRILKINGLVEKELVHFVWLVVSS